MGQDNLDQDGKSPVTYIHDSIDQGTTGDVHYIVPRGWPVVPLGPGVTKEDTDDDVTRLASALKEARIGKVVRGKKVSTSAGPLEIPLFVKTKKGPNVPVFFQYTPFPSDVMETLRPILTIRSAWKFRLSSIALFSYHPIDAEVVYHCSGSPEATFESEAFSVYEYVRPDIKGMAKRCDQAVGDHFKVYMVFREKMLPELDDITRRLHWTENTPVMVPTGFLLGTYLGQVIRNCIGGDWVTEASGLPVLLVDGERYSPITEVMQRIKKLDGIPPTALFEEIKAKKQ